MNSILRITDSILIDNSIIKIVKRKNNFKLSNYFFK